MKGKIKIMLAGLILLSICISFYLYTDNMENIDDSNSQNLPALNDDDKNYLMNTAYTAAYEYFDMDYSSSVRTGRFFSSFSEKYNNISNTVFIGFFINNTKRGSFSSKSYNLAKTTHQATINTLKDTRYGGVLKKEELPLLEIEIYVLGEEKPVDAKKFKKDFNLGIDGIRIENGNKHATFYNSVPITNNYNAQKTLERLCLKAKLNIDCYDDNNTQIYLFKTIHFIKTCVDNKENACQESSSLKIITLHRANYLIGAKGFGSEELKTHLELAKAWLLSNVEENGSIPYAYTPSLDSYSSQNNMIRQFMASYLLSKLAKKEQNNETLQNLSKKNLNYNSDEFYFGDVKNNMSFIYYNGTANIGSSALAVLAFMGRGKEYDQKAALLANFLLSMQNENGSFGMFLFNKNNFPEEEYIRYYSGEAMLALIKMYSYTGNTIYLNATVKAADYYIPYIKKDFHPAYIPWHTMALYELYKIKNDRKYADFIFYLNDPLADMQISREEVSEDDIDYTGSFYDEEHPEFGPPFAASTAVYVEGLAYAYDVAAKLHDQKRMEIYKKAILSGCKNLVDLQYYGGNMYYIKAPQKVAGSIRSNPKDNKIRIDSTQHTIDAFNAVLEFLPEKEIDK